jgi:hypothetical protein
MRKGLPLLLRKLDPETPISTPAPPRLIAGSEYSHPPESLFTCSESLSTSPRNRYPHAQEYAPKWTFFERKITEPWFRP